RYRRDAAEDRQGTMVAPAHRSEGRAGRLGWQSLCKNSEGRAVHARALQGCLDAPDGYTCRQDQEGRLYFSRAARVELRKIPGNGLQRRGDRLNHRHDAADHQALPALRQPEEPCEGGYASPRRAFGSRIIGKFVTFWKA